METKTSILIADDHEIFRVGLMRTIECDKQFSVIEQTDNGEDALALIKTMKPDIAILDISMPIMNGLDVGRAVYQEGLLTELVFLTMYDDMEYFNAAMEIGARGYLLKHVAGIELLTCLRSVAEGNHYISPVMSHLLIERNKRMEGLQKNVPSMHHLSPAENHILTLLADNLTNKEIANKLFVSIRTVENHRMHICHKLGIKGHNRLLQFALENRSVFHQFSTHGNGMKVHCS